MEGKKKCVIRGARKRVADCEVAMVVLMLLQVVPRNKNRKTIGFELEKSITRNSTDKPQKFVKPLNYPHFAIEMIQV